MHTQTHSLRKVVTQCKLPAISRDTFCIDSHTHTHTHSHSHSHTHTHKGVSLAVFPFSPASLESKLTLLKKSLVKGEMKLSFQLVSPASEKGELSPRRQRCKGEAALGSRQEMVVGGIHWDLVTLLVKHTILFTTYSFCTNVSLEGRCWEGTICC